MATLHHRSGLGSLIDGKSTIFQEESVGSPKELGEYHPLHKEDREPVLAEFLQETNPTETTFGINYLKNRLGSSLGQSSRPPPNLDVKHSS